MMISPSMLLLVIVGLLAAFAVILYNRLVVLRNRWRNAFAQIDVQLRRRHDLIPNLVETARGYMAHESGTLEAVVVARAQAQRARRAVMANPESVAALGKLAAAETDLTTGVNTLLALAENYPVLKGDQTMMQLSEELTSTENRIAFARQAFNDCVTAYNSGIELFPAAMVAAPLGFRPAGLLQAVEDESARRVTPITFGAPAIGG